MNQPARGYSWPPFQPGHTLSTVHGAESPRVIAAKAKEVHEALLECAPYLAEDKFLPAVNRYLTAAAREALLDNHIQSVSASKGAGAVPLRMWEQVTAAARLAAKLGSDLGLDPLGHARIRALSAGAEATQAAMTDLRQRGAALVEAQQAKETPPHRSAEPRKRTSGSEVPDAHEQETTP